MLGGLVLLWAVAGHAFYRIDRLHDREGHKLLTELVEHKAALAQATPGPRVVIAGGSNVYYGLDAGILQDELNVPVVNLALPFDAHHHAIALDLLEHQVQPGDIVVFSAGGLWDPALPPTRRAREFDSYLDEAGLAGYTRKFPDASLPWRPLPETGPLLLAAASGLKPEDGRSWVADTDALGNYTACIDAPVVRPRHYFKDSLNEDLIEALRGAAQRFEGDDIHLVVSLPWLFIRESDRDRWTDFRRRLVAALDDAVPIVASRTDMLLRSRRGDFCDSPLHLSAAASRERSRALAEALRPLLIVE